MCFYREGVAGCWLVRWDGSRGGEPHMWAKPREIGAEGGGGGESFYATTASVFFFIYFLYFQKH